MGRLRATRQPLSTGQKSIHTCYVMSSEGQLLKETKIINFGQLCGRLSAGDHRTVTEFYI